VAGATNRWAPLLLAAAAAGCGYSTASLYPENVRTIAVPIFASKEFRRELEFDLTRDLVQTIEARTGYKVVHDRARADTELRGEVLELRTPVISEDTDTDRPVDVEVILTCWFEWRDLRSGQVLARRDRLSASSTYAPAIGSGLDSATHEASRYLAERIVEAMEKDWSIEGQPFDARTESAGR
jgi:hypothetical protein